MSVKTCYKGKLFADKIKQALGVSVDDAVCYIVDETGMQEAMSSAGWARNEMDGVVGFQVNKNIYVRDDSKWTTLHELVHRAGINADRLNRYVAEGLTEAVAEKLRTTPDEHRPTYPEETAWVKQVLLPKLKMTEIQLASALVKVQEPHKLLAQMIQVASPKVDLAKLTDELKPQRPMAPNIGSANQEGSAKQGKRTVETERGGRPSFGPPPRPAPAKPAEPAKPVEAARAVESRVAPQPAAMQVRKPAPPVRREDALLTALAPGKQARIGGAEGVGLVLILIGSTLVAPTVISQVSRKVF